MREHDVLEDGQPQARASRLAGTRLVHAIKALEEPGKMFGGDARPEIADVKLGSVLRLLHTDGNLVAFSRIFQRVVNQIGKNLVDRLRIGGNHRVRRVMEDSYGAALWQRGDGDVKCAAGNKRLRLGSCDLLLFQSLIQRVQEVGITNSFDSGHAGAGLQWKKSPHRAVCPLKFLLGREG